MSKNIPLPEFDGRVLPGDSWPLGDPSPKKKRVEVIFGFQGDVPKGYAPPTHLPGAVIDMAENHAIRELRLQRVREVDPTTPLRDGFQPETTGETAEEIAKRKAAEAAAKETAREDELKELRAEIEKLKRGK